MTDSSKTGVGDIPVLFPIDQAERAKQIKPNHLLAQDVFARIKIIVDEALARVKRIETSGITDLDWHRSHDSVLLQGARGTGKSSILVNLGLYFKDYDDLLILKPIDPTSLEDGENLFLNMFIAGLVRDSEVRKKIDAGCREVEDFFDRLNKLGAAIEASATLNEKQGTDKIRALIGSNATAERVHELFLSTLRLTGKKLIVMPIDDVDTALQYAYEKIEIVRKYLVSPYILPIISGDIELYDEVIWRNFHGRLTKESKAEEENALVHAYKLSIEYQRKILPLSKRIAVPELGTYLNNPDIYLSKEEKEFIPFPTFKLWLEAILNERVNGVENSYLPLPVTTVREFAQFVAHLQPLLQKSNSILNQGASEGKYYFRRRMFMSEDIAKAIDNFGRQYAGVRIEASKEARRNARDKAFAELQNSLVRLVEQKGLDSDKEPFDSEEWQEAMLDHFKYLPAGGAAFLVLEANRYFLNQISKTSEERISIFDTPLFQPKKHKDFPQFASSKKIHTEWIKHLNQRMPEELIDYLPKSSILPYPLPELGMLITAEKNQVKKSRTLNGTELEDAELIRRLMTHYNFYSKTNRSHLVLSGRIVELVVTSLIREITVDDVLDMIYLAPFHSAASIANTKTLEYDRDDTKEVEYDVNDMAQGDTLSTWIKEINEWRKKNGAYLDFPPNAWLIYNVVNKFFSQSPFFGTLPQPPRQVELQDVFGMALLAYRTLWAAFGSFEKSEIFGFDKVIAYQNINNVNANFEQNQLYRQNILPFLRKSNFESSEKYFDFRTGAYTYLLSNHPLKEKLEETYKKIQEEFADRKQKNRLVVQEDFKELAKLSRGIKAKLNEAHEILFGRIPPNGEIEAMAGDVIAAALKVIQEHLGEEYDNVCEHARNTKESRSGLSKLKFILERNKELNKLA